MAVVIVMVVLVVMVEVLTVVMMGGLVLVVGVMVVVVVKLGKEVAVLMVGLVHKIITCLSVFPFEREKYSTKFLNICNRMIREGFQKKNPKCKLFPNWR